MKGNRSLRSDRKMPNSSFKPTPTARLNSGVRPHMKTYDDVREAFDSGSVVDASKEDLVQLLLAVGRARVLDPANQARAAEMGETMRQLLAARQSEAMHSQALSTSRIALVVSVIALVASIGQLLAELDII